MVAFNLEIDVPTANVTALAAALNWHLAGRDGGDAGLTSNELRTSLATWQANKLNAIYRDYQQYLRDEAAADDLGATAP